MGYDISYHPVDVDLIHTRILPYILGEGGIDDLVDDAVRLAKVRFHANAWGLGVMDLHHKEVDAILEANPIPKPPRSTAKPIGFLGRLLGKKPPPAPAPPPPPPLPKGEIEQAGFDSDLHVWGRPFFITQDDPAQVSAAIDRYTTAQPADVEAIAKEMITGLMPSLLDRVEPSKDGTLPPDDQIAKGIRWKIDLFRDAHEALKQGQSQVTDPDGNKHDAKELFKGDCALAVVEFQAQLRPGWMARGYGWPSHLFELAGIDEPGLFEKPEPIFTPLMEAHPEVAAHFEPTIIENYMLGGFVAAERVPKLVELLKGSRDKINQATMNEGWGDGEADLYVQGCLEAALDAQRRGVAFVEAAEVYSGPLGMMN